MGVDFPDRLVLPSIMTQRAIFSGPKKTRCDCRRHQGGKFSGKIDGARLPY